MENPEFQVLASTLMAQRPIARTALRTKSTSTSVAYSFSSARTCKANRPTWGQGHTGRMPTWQAMPPEQQNTCRMNSSTASHTHSKQAVKPCSRCLPLKPTLLGGKMAWSRQPGLVQAGWSQNMAPSRSPDQDQSHQALILQTRPYGDAIVK